MFVDLTPPNEVEQLVGNLVRAWGKQQTQRLVIWYVFQGGIHSKYSPLPSITDDLEPPASIAGTPTP